MSEQRTRYSVRKLDNGWGIDIAGEIGWTEGPFPKGLAQRVCTYLNNEREARLSAEADNARYRAALEEIARVQIEDDPYPLYAVAGAHAACVAIARSALTDSSEVALPSVRRAASTTSKEESTDA